MHDQRLRRTWHIIFNCECRHATTASEAVEELDDLLAELDRTEMLKNLAESRVALLEVKLREAHEASRV